MNAGKLGGYCEACPHRCHTFLRDFSFGSSDVVMDVDSFHTASTSRWTLNSCSIKLRNHATCMHTVGPVMAWV